MRKPKIPRVIDGVIAAGSILLAAVVVTLMVNRLGGTAAMTPAQVAEATRQCERAGWNAQLFTRANGEQYIACKGTENAP